MADDDLRFGDLDDTNNTTQQTQIEKYTQLAIQLFVLLVVLYTLGKSAMIILL